MMGQLRALIQGLALAALAVAAAIPAAAKDYLLTAVKPDKLVLVDPGARKVERVYDMPESAPGALTITPAPDGKVAYLIVNRWESVVGIDLDSGEMVFRADFSSDEERVKATFGMDISPDGRELFVFQSPVRLGKDVYEVQPTRIAVYDTSAGLAAKPKRSFEAPRRTAILTLSADGSKLYAVSWDIYVLDPQSGQEIGRHRLRTWERENFSEPDVLDVWPQWEVADIFSTPYYTVRTDKSPDDPEAYITGLATLDIATDEFKIVDFENTEAIIFSTVINPVRPAEVYGVYTTLSKIDREAGKLVKRIDLEHTYYAINIASDGSEVYVGGTMDDITVYDTQTLEKVGRIEMPGGADQALSSLRLIQR